MKDYTKEQTNKLVTQYIETHGLQISLEEIESLIYEVENHSTVMHIWIDVCERAGLDIDQNSLDLIMNCWNNFPQKALGGKSPNQMSTR